MGLLRPLELGASPPRGRWGELEQGPALGAMFRADTLTKGQGTKEGLRRSQEPGTFLDGPAQGTLCSSFLLPLISLALPQEHFTTWEPLSIPAEIPAVRISLPLQFNPTHSWVHLTSGGSSHTLQLPARVGTAHCPVLALDCHGAREFPMLSWAPLPRPAEQASSLPGFPLSSWNDTRQWYSLGRVTWAPGSNCPSAPPLGLLMDSPVYGVGHGVSQKERDSGVWHSSGHV